MTEIPVYNRQGEHVASFTVPHDIEFVSGRTSRSGDIFYKGVGAPYRCHFTRDPEAPGVRGRADVFYAGFWAVDPCFEGKYGIFQQRYQPYFRDWIGACGPKEEKIVPHSRDFPLSAITVVDQVTFDRQHRQSYYVLKYKTGREPFLEGGDFQVLQELLKTMIRFGWNFPWDKAAIRDVTKDGMISDVADLFRSKKLKHQLGTVYAVIYSLHSLLPAQYRNLFGNTTPIYASVSLLAELGVKLPGSMAGKKTKREISQAALKLLVEGRSCAGIEDKVFGETVREQYRNQIKEKMQG